MARTLIKSKLFDYDGCILTGTLISYGNSNQINFTKKDWDNLRNSFLNHHLGKKIKIGASRNNPALNSLGEWLQKNITKTAIASYIASILVREHYAIYEGESIIRIIK